MELDSKQALDLLCKETRFDIYFCYQVLKDRNWSYEVSKKYLDSICRRCKSELSDGKCFNCGNIPK